MEIRIRLGSGVASFARSPMLSLELPGGATIGELLERLAEVEPELAPALRSALPLIGGEHAERMRVLHHGEEVALLMPVAGGDLAVSNSDLTRRVGWPRTKQR